MGNSNELLLQNPRNTLPANVKNLPKTDSSKDNFEFLPELRASSQIKNKPNLARPRKNSRSVAPSKEEQRKILPSTSRSGVLNNPFFRRDVDGEISFERNFVTEKEMLKEEYENIYFDNLLNPRHESHKPNTDLGCDTSEIQIKHSQSCVLESNKIELEYELKMTVLNDKLRKAYISKLIATQSWKPKDKVKKHNSIFIFDWDDTLLCTSYLTPSGIFSEDCELSRKDREKLSRIEGFVLKILTFAVSKGETYIITNAAPGWVEFSCQKFYPKLSKIISKVQVVSARGNYEKVFPSETKQWKIHSFLELTKHFNLELVSNIICVGDSMIEMEAAHILASKFNQAYIKTVKFRETPKPEELVKQLCLVYEKLPHIYSKVENLSIKVERKGRREAESLVSHGKQN